VLLKIYDVINFDKAFVVKMAASTVTMDAIDYSKVTLIDSDDNKVKIVNNNS